MMKYSEKGDSEAEVELEAIESAYGKSTKGAEELSSNVSSIKILPKRITIGKPIRAVEVTYECKNDEELPQFIFGAICLLFHHVSSRPNDYSENKLSEIKDVFLQLTAFVNQYDSTGHKFKIIKDFETYLVNQNLKGSVAQRTLSHLNEAKNLKTITKEQVNLIQAINKATKLNPIESEQHPLTSWFSEINWLRAKMEKEYGAGIYSRLNSPRLLVQSFNITIAELMTILQEVSRDLSDVFKQKNVDTTLLMSLLEDKSKQDRVGWLLREMLYAATREGCRVNKLTEELLIYDFCPKNRRNDISIRLHHNEELYVRTSQNKKNINNFNKPLILDEGFIKQLIRYASGEQEHYPVSKAEEICFYWLNCAQTVQASNARKLTYQDFIFHGTPNHITHLSSDYFKTRARDFKVTDTLDTKLPVGKALLCFLENKKAIGVSNALISLKSKDVDTSTTNFVGVIGKLFLLFSESTFESRIYSKLQQQSTSTLFLNLIQCLTSHGDMTMAHWASQKKKRGEPVVSRKVYQSEIDCWLPSSWFSGSMVKTSAVHAESGKFRYGELVNNKSHSGSTEHNVYFSEQNEEHINMSGRLMRLVMEDIENVAFKPDLEEVGQNIIDRQVRTQIVSETTGTICPLNSSGSVELKPEEVQGDAIIVVDSVETVVDFLHYINQAKKNYTALATHNPDFLEKSVLVEAEWKEDVLNNLISKESKAKGVAAYEQYKAMLPELFMSQIRA